VYTIKTIKMTQDNRDRDIANVVQALVGLLNRAIQDAGLERPCYSAKGMNEAYFLQTEMAHLLYDLTHGPICLAQKVIADCNDLINSVNQR